MNINLENFTVIENFGQNDIYERLIAFDEQENLKIFVKKTTNSILQNDFKRKHFENELSANQTFDHENIVIFIDKKQILNDIYLIFEATNGGTLADYVKKYTEKNKKPLPEEIVQYIIKQISAALKYLHDKHVIYRNLSLEHIYLNFENDEDAESGDITKAKLKLGNFHLCKVLEDNELAHSFIGIPVYMDPNIVLKERNSIAYEYKADVWSLGSICFELLTGKTAFDGSGYDELVENIKGGKYSISTDLNLSKEAISFITSILQYDSTKRLDIDGVLAHDFLKKDTKEFSHEGIEQFGEIKEKELILDIKINQ